MIVKPLPPSRTAWLHSHQGKDNTKNGPTSESLTTIAKFKSKARSQFKAKARLELVEQIEKGLCLGISHLYKSKYKGRDLSRSKPTDISLSTPASRYSASSMYIFAPMNSSAPNASRARNFLTKLTLNGARDSDQNFFLSANSLLPFQKLSRPDRKKPTSKAGPLSLV